MKILIFAPPGCYRNFVAWVISVANQKLTDADLPFSPTGNVHKIHSQENLKFFDIANNKQIKSFLQSDYEIGLLHPDKELLLNNLYKDFKLISVGFDNTSKIWILNNVVTKISTYWQDSLAGMLQASNLEVDVFPVFMEKWGNKPINEYAIWELREGLSHYLPFIESSDDPLGMKGLAGNLFGHDFGIYFDVKEFRDNFHETFIKLFHYCEIDYKEENLDFIKTSWFNSQLHMYKDSLVDDIVGKILDNVDFELSHDLTLIDEAYVQRKLRNAGIELRCYNLNQFPKNNVDFQSLLYYNFDTLIKNNFNEIIVRFYNKQLSFEDAISQVSAILEKIND